MQSLGILWRFCRQKSCHLLLILWIFTFFYKVKGVPIESIFKKARCYANCLTQVRLAASNILCQEVVMSTLSDLTSVRSLIKFQIGNLLAIVTILINYLQIKDYL